MYGRKIKVTIDQLGRPVVEAVGFNGQGCSAATDPIEKALAGDAKAGATRVLKPEWQNYGTEENTEQARQQW